MPFYNIVFIFVNFTFKLYRKRLNKEDKVILARIKKRIIIVNANANNLQQ